MTLATRTPGLAVRLAVVLTTVGALTGCSSGTETSDAADRPRRPAPETAAAPSDDAPAGQDGTDDSVREYLDGRGITDAMVRELGATADRTGYGLGDGTKLPFEQAQNFASVMVMTCDQVTGGELTWEESIAEDVAAGASRGDAREMNRYLREEFCPPLT